MDFLTNLAQGFQIGLLPINLLYCFIGVLLGTLIGVLPGIGPSATIALLLPTTFRISPVSAIIMLAGIYYGAQYGGSTTSILVNIPGEAASVVTCLDGYKMARKGRAGPALGISAFGSFIAGTLSVLGLMILAIPLSHIALKFGFPEYFAIMCLGLSIVSYLGRGSFFKSLLMAAVGVSISFIAMDVVVGKPRFDFGLLVPAFILGPQMEQAFRQSLIMSDGSLLVFFTRPISAGAMGLAVFLLISAFIPAWKKRREKIEGDTA